MYHICEHDDPYRPVDSMKRISDYIPVQKRKRKLTRVEKHDKTQSYDGSRNSERSHRQKIGRLSDLLKLSVGLNHIRSDKRDDCSEKCGDHGDQHGIFKRLESLSGRGFRQVVVGQSKSEIVRPQSDNGSEKCDEKKQQHRGCYDNAKYRRGDI